MSEQNRIWLDRPWFPALVCGAIALVVRVLYVLDIQSLVLFDAPIMDAAVHDGWARGTIDLFYKDIPYFRAPLYPWFLQFVYAIDDSYLAPRLWQALLSAATVAFVADSARRLASPLAGLCAGLLLAFTWPAIYFSGELLIVTLFMALVVPALWCLIRAGIERSWRLALCGAALLGIAAIARPTALVMLPVLLWLALRSWPGGGWELARPASLRLAAAMLLLLLLPALALSVRNKIVGDDWVFLASQGGVNFYIGNNPQSDGRTAVVPGTSGTWMGGYRDTIRRARRAEGRPLKASEVSRYYTREALAYLREQPADATKLYLRKLRLLLGAGERSNNQNIHFWRAQSHVLRLPIYVSWAVLLALGLCGLFLHGDRRRMAPISGFLLFYALGLLAFFVNERFRLPLAIVLAIPAGLGLAQIVAAFRAAKWRLAGSVAGAAFAIYALSSLDRIDFRENRIDADAFSRYSVGNAYLGKGQPREALNWYADSQRIAREFGLKHFDEVETQLMMNRVRALEALNEAGAAERELLLLESRIPESAELYALRGDLHRMQWQYNQAFAAYREALRRDPRNGEATLGLAWCLLDRREYSGARQNFQKVLRAEPENSSAIAGLATTDLWESGGNPRAIEQLRRALRINPEEAAAHRMLAEYYRLEKKVPEAIWHYREAVRIDPWDEGSRRFLNRAGIPHEHQPGDVAPPL